MKYDQDHILRGSGYGLSKWSPRAGAQTNCGQRLFNRNGFEVSVDGIMAQAGLTRGAFYSYFKSKSDLYAETLTCFFTDPNWDSRWEGVEVDLTSPEAGSEIIRAYLSRQHLENLENSCPMALPGDVARGDGSVKSAFEAVVKAMVAILRRKVRGASRESEETAMAIAARCIGGTVVARALNGGEFSDRLRDAAMHTALFLGGWDSGCDSGSAPRSAQSGQPLRKTARQGKGKRSH
ncbi:MAG TPA: TetR/AcrR family transcriptional regulator [Bryobacteraceae bacterium]|nr:TetR/AcrR family transcriptional regulator [Bryobacteraceae bacterium]